MQNVAPPPVINFKKTMSIQHLLEKQREEFVEKGADLEHDRWGRWQDYMFSKGKVEDNGDFILPKEFVDRWFRQINTSYSELSEPEKESDRKETRNYLPLLSTIQQEILSEIKKKIEESKIKIDWTRNQNATRNARYYNSGLDDLSSWLEGEKK